MLYFEGNKNLQVGGFVDCALLPSQALVEKNPRE